MSLNKVIKDWLFKLYLGKETVPSGLNELNHYFAVNGPINFNFHHEDGIIVATSENFRYGSIVTFAASKEELDKKIKDAILTSFSVPSSYSKEANIHNLKEAGTYATA